MTKNLLESSLKNIPKDRLITPIVYDYSILKKIKYCDYIISSLPDNNKVKIYLSKELKNIIIKRGKLGKNHNDIIKNVNMVMNYLKIDKQERDKNFYNNSYIFKINNVLLNSKLNKSQQYEINKLSQISTEKVTNFKYSDQNILYKTTELTLIGNCGRTWKSVTNFYNVNPGSGSYSKSFDILSCCYVIAFKNNLYYYIGSTINIKDRVRDHYLKIQRIIEKVTKDGFYNNRDVKTYYNSNKLEYYIASEIINHKINLEYTILPIYFCTNYLKNFEMLNPEYELSKGERLLLISITELIIRILEQSLILEFKPKLNILNKVGIRYFDWNNSYLEEYINPSCRGKEENSLTDLSPKAVKETNKINTPSKEYTNTVKCFIFIPQPKNSKMAKYWDIDRLRGLNILGIEKSENVKYSRKGPKTLKHICEKYSLNINEVLENHNKLHNYKGCNLKQPIIIISTLTTLRKR